LVILLAGSRGRDYPPDRRPCRIRGRL